MSRLPECHHRPYISAGRYMMIKKRCDEHDSFNDAYWSEVTLDKSFMGYWIDGSGIDGSLQSVEGCLCDCGICENRKTGKLLANIDVTSNFSLFCTVYFAAASDSSNEPSVIEGS
jgi:uncharacterized radical SAM superfamily Fe-S cluster-containing enzyme